MSERKGGSALLQPVRSTKDVAGYNACNLDGSGDAAKGSVLVESEGPTVYWNGAAGAVA